MKTISQFVLRKIYGNDFPNLERAINYLDEHMQDRFVEMLINVDIDDSVLPKKIKRNNVIYTIKSTNYLKDEITASYVGTDVRYFSNQEDADNYAATGNYNYNTSSYNESDKCPIKSEYTSEKETWFNYNSWMNSEVVE